MRYDTGCGSSIRYRMTLTTTLPRSNRLVSTISLSNASQIDSVFVYVCFVLDDDAASSEDADTILFYNLHSCHVRFFSKFTFCHFSVFSLAILPLAFRKRFTMSKPVTIRLPKCICLDTFTHVTFLSVNPYFVSSTYFSLAILSLAFRKRFTMSKFAHFVSRNVVSDTFIFYSHPCENGLGDIIAIVVIVR